MGRIAQLVEQKTLNLLVGGSSPPAPTSNITMSLVDLLLGLEGRSQCEFVQSIRRTPRVPACRNFPSGKLPEWRALLRPQILLFNTLK
jgi:hypothetical protein